MSEKKIKWGFIGCGEVTKHKSGPAFQKVESSEVIAVMSRDGAKAKAYAQERGIPKWYNDAQELIDDEDVNAIYIATPPSSHATYAIMAMKAGKPVYIEKPMAVTYEECCRINRISNETGVPCFVAYYRRYLPYFLKVKELVENGTIGNIINIQIRFAQPPRDLDYNKENLPWRVQPDIAGGGYFYDLAPHQIDLLQDMFGCILEANGYKVTHDSDHPQGEVAVINTCGFIGDAKEESINMILEFCQAKEEGRLKKLYVMGCLSERYLKDLQMEIPQVDKFYGKFNWNELLADLGKAYHSEFAIERHLTTPKHYAYLKISEGCDRKCSYCAIPIITGRHISRPMEEIIDEVKLLVSEGVKEFQIIAQELTYYGVDLYKSQKLPELIERIANVPGVEWIRLHYAYPAHFPEELFRVMREHDNVCKYMDIALQHISDNMLNKMRRHVSKAETYELIEKFRREVPGIHLRTTLMVGHPGETEEDFEELKEFVKKVRFDRMGAFAYSEEEGTFAAKEYEDSISHEVKQQRLDELMALQQEIAGELSQTKIGKEFKVIIDRKEGDYYIGRTQFDSPEVDPEVLIKADDEYLKIGEFYKVKITAADDFDLYASIL